MKWWPGGTVRQARPCPATRDVPAVAPLHGAAALHPASHRLLARLRATADGSFRRRRSRPNPDPSTTHCQARVLVRRKPLIATWHEVWGKDYWRSYLGPLGVVAALLERLVLRLPDRVIAVSEGTAERIRHASCGRLPVFVGYNGIDPQEIIDASVESTQHDLLFVGRLLDHKGVDVLIDTVAELSRCGTSLSLTIIGKGPKDSELRSAPAAHNADLPNLHLPANCPRMPTS